MREAVVRGVGLGTAVLYALLIVWVYARQPETFAQIRGGVAAGAVEGDGGVAGSAEAVDGGLAAGVSPGMGSRLIEVGAENCGRSATGLCLESATG